MSALRKISEGAGRKDRPYLNPYKNRTIVCPKNSMVLIIAVVLTVIYLIPQTIEAAYVEMWPSEGRRNNTLFCYGNDWNWALIVLDPNQGKHKLDLPVRFVEEAVLEVTLPRAVEFLGAHTPELGEVSRNFEQRSLMRDGKEYTHVRIPLDNEMLNRRLPRWHYRIYIWFGSPETIDDTISYELYYGGAKMAAGASRLVTAGELVHGRNMPVRFGFYPYGSFSVVPEDDFDRMADFYSRLGIAGIEASYQYGRLSTSKFPEIYKANHRHGVKNMANMTLFGRRHGKRLYGGSMERTMEAGGLVAAMDKVCAGLESAEAIEDWREAHEFFDMAFWNWEPQGPNQWPGYEDEATIAAFAKARGITEELTGELLRTAYREAYAKFRMEQIARPLYSMRKTIDAVKPIPFRVEQGAGARRNIDYDIYGHDFDALTPMIYQPSPIRYAEDLINMVGSTSVLAEKFWPDMTLGYSRAGVLRESPQELLLDTVVTAAAGCGSVSYWPGIHLTDASWFGIHEGLTRIALVEDFYLDGISVDTVDMEGLPYREEKIDLGYRMIYQFSPDWRSWLITFAHQLEREYLFTLLNYHSEEDAFVRVNAPKLRGFYLVNPVDEVYQVFDDTGSALVRVGKESSGMWIATSSRVRIAEHRRIEADEVRAQFERTRDIFILDERAGAVALGKVRDINVAYRLIAFAGEDRVALQVETPKQTISFGSSGGRIYDWKVRGMDSFVAKDNFSTDGMGKDLLWLPASARWGGDEVLEMDLVEVANDGCEAKVVYEGEFSDSYPGIHRRKVYRVSAEDSTINVDITLRNNLVDVMPVELSYWSHNVLSPKKAHFINEELIHQTSTGTTTIFISAGLSGQLEKKVLMPERIVDVTGPVYAEFFPDDNSGLIFRLPENFMNVYRWSSIHHAKIGSEWMSRPLSLHAGTSITLSYSITAVPDATPELLREVVSKMMRE